MPRFQPTAVTLALLWAATSAAALDVTVKVQGIQSDAGRIGCALHSDGSAFPLRPSATSQWVKPQNRSATCRFTNVSPGTYAVAVIHDANGNGKVDTNAVGLPQEDWGVSRDVRPALRPPRFAEAALNLSGSAQTVTIRIK